jgi:cell division protein FtsZ
LLQTRKEPEKFNLENEVKEIHDEVIEEKKDDKFEVIFPEKEEEVDFNQPLKVTFEKRIKKKTDTDKSLFSSRKKKKKSKKIDEPVAESNIDNWFYKNFGLGRFFEDEDQPMEQ